MQKNTCSGKYYQFNKTSDNVVFFVVFTSALDKTRLVFFCTFFVLLLMMFIMFKILGKTRNFNSELTNRISLKNSETGESEPGIENKS